jgi:N-acetyl-anhydromuramyl-L-alanine amidase AmpD
VVIIIDNFKIEWKPSPNYSKGRAGRKPIAIVNHITAGLMPGTLSWLCNPQAQASAHYLVTKVGQIFQLVKDEDTSWHAGIVNRPKWPLYDGTNPNRYTIGIEYECVSGGKLTEIQYQAGLWLTQKIIKKYTIPIDRNHIIGHYLIDTINRPNDPGPEFPWDRLFDDLNGADEMAVETKIVVNGKPITGYILKDNLSYAPVRALSEALGAKVDWDSVKRVVTVQGGSK